MAPAIQKLRQSGGPTPPKKYAAIPLIDEEPKKSPRSSRGLSLKRQDRITG
jgi:hypothetical protein